MPLMRFVIAVRGNLCALPVAIISRLCLRVCCSQRTSLGSSFLAAVARGLSAWLLYDQHIRPHVIQEMDGQWLLGWLCDSAAISQAVLSTGETAPAVGRMDGGVG